MAIGRSRASSPAIDVTGATGQKPSRSARSATAQIGQPKANVTSRDFKREFVAERQGDLSEVGLAAGAFADFFSAQVPAQKARDEEDQREEDRLEIMKIEAAVNADRAGAREAMLTGYLDNFVSPNMQNSRAAMAIFNSIVATNMATEDWDDTGRDGLNSLDINADPEGYVSAFIKGGIKGGTPIFKRDYGRAILARATKDIKDFKTQRDKVIQSRAFNNAMNEARIELTDGTISADYTSMQAIYTRVLGSLPFKGPKQVLEVEAAMDMMIAKLAAEGNATAMAFLIMARPNVYKDGVLISGHNGLSIDVLNPGLYAKALAQDKSRLQNSLSTKLTVAAAKIEDDLSLFLQTGEGHLPEIWLRMRRLVEENGNSTTARTLRDKFNAALKGQAAGMATMIDIVNGSTAGIGPKAWRKMAKNLINEDMARLAAEKAGKPFPLAQQRLRAFWAMRGDPDWRGKTSALLMSPNSSAEEVTEAFTLLNIAHHTRAVRLDDPGTGLISTESLGIFIHMMRVQRGGGSHLEARLNILEKMKQNGGRLDLRDAYFKKILNADGDTPGATGVEKRSKEVWKKLKLTDAQDYENLDEPTKTLLRQVVNTAFAIGGGSDEDVVSFAQELVRNAFGMQWIDGKFGYTLTRAPTMVLNAQHELIPGAQVTSKVMHRVVEAFESNPGIMQTASIISPAGFGLANSDNMRNGWGFDVINNENGKHISFVADRIFQMDFTTFPFLGGDVPTSAFIREFITTVDDGSGEGFMQFRAPSKPRPGEALVINLDKNLFLVYDRARNAWSMQYRDEGPPQISARELSELQAIKQYNKMDHKGSQARAWKRTLELHQSVVDASLLTIKTGPDMMEGSDNPLQAQEEELPEDLDGVIQPSPVTDVGPIGSQVLTEDEDDYTSPETLEGVSQLRSLGDEVVDWLVKVGFLTPQSVQMVNQDIARSDDGASVNELLDDTADKNRGTGGNSDTPKTKISETFGAKNTDFVAGLEEFIALQYNDHKPKGAHHWNPGDEGNPTIGYGYNLHRPNARAEIKEWLGVDIYDGLMDGQISLTKPQAMILLERVMKESTAYVRTEFKHLNLLEHQMRALISMVYNSKWYQKEDLPLKGPTLMGPNIRKFLDAREWDKVGFEIAWRSQNVHHHLIAGIHNRRVKEAIMFLGPELAATQRYISQSFLR